MLKLFLCLILLGVYGAQLVFSISIGSAYASAANFFDEIILIFIYLLLLPTLIKQKRIRVPCTVLLFSFMLLYSSLLGIFKSELNFLAVLLSIIFILKPYVIVYTGEVIPVTLKSLSDAMPLWRRLLASCLILFLIGAIFLDYLLLQNPLPGFELGARFGITPARSFFCHPYIISTLGIYAGMFFYVRWKIHKNWKDFVCVVISSLLVLISLRLRVMIFFVAGIGTVHVMHDIFERRSSKWITSLVTMLAVLTPLITLIIFYSWKNDFSIYFSSFDSVRTKLLATSLYINMDTFGLGEGPGMFGSVMSVKFYSPLYFEYGFHNIYGANQSNTSHITDQWWAWYLGEIGVVGFILFTLFIFKIIFTIWNNLCRFGQDYSALIPFYLSSIFMLFYVYFSGAFSGDINGPPLSYLVLITSGICLAASSNKSQLMHSKS